MPLPVSTHHTHSLGPLEVFILRELDKLKTASVKAIFEAMQRQRSYTTIKTVLDRLSDKGLVRRHQLKGEKYLTYTARQTFKEVRYQATQAFIDVWKDDGILPSPRQKLHQDWEFS
jgi:predicted transcriptional regulator